MNRENLIIKLIEEASTHNPDEVMCAMAGYRKDNGKDHYTWGEYLESLKTQSGSVWEESTKEMVDLIEQHPKIFKINEN